MSDYPRPASLLRAAGVRVAPPRRGWLMGLTFRYILQLVGVGLFLSGLIIWNASSRQKDTVFEEMRQRATLLGQSLAGATALPHFFGDRDTLTYVLKSAGDIQDVVYIALVNPEGQPDIVVGKDRSAIDRPARPAPMDRLTCWVEGDLIHVTAPLIIERRARPGVADMLSEETQETGGPAQKTFLGHIHITMSLARAQSLVQATVARSAAATLIIILFGSIVAFLFFRKDVLLPIHRLVAAMTEVRRGNLTLNLDEAGGPDEIKTLTRTFNEMTNELHGAEEQLKRANMELEARVLQRTRDLEKANQELRDSQERVVRSEKLAAIGQLASGVGHELRNPLGAIRNVVYYIRDALKDSTLAQSDPAMPELLELADKEIKSATHIIGDLLDFSRVVRLAPQQVEINAILRDTVALVERPATVELDQSLAENLPPVMADPERLKQVFINLMTNAVQAMTKGGKLWLRSRPGETSDGRPAVAVEVQDTGSGIRPENLRKIFEPLFSTKAKGTGLGLAICQGIMEAHGGKITVASELEKGSTFTVVIPLGGKRHDSQTGQ